jgi:hypothetical protein
MALLVPNTGEVLALGAFLNKVTPQDQVLKLFKSNTTPAESDTAATYTEATFTGYSSVALAGASWTVTGGNPTSASYAQQSFTSSANQTPETIYGYYIVQASSGTLMYAERFSASQVIQNNNDVIRVTPTITAD